MLFRSLAFTILVRLAECNDASDEDCEGPELDADPGPKLGTAVMAGMLFVSNILTGESSGNSSMKRLMFFTGVAESNNLLEGRNISLLEKLFSALFFVLLGTVELSVLVKIFFFGTG